MLLNPVGMAISDEHYAVYSRNKKIGFTIVIKQIGRASHKAVPTGLEFNNALGRGFASFTPP